MESAGVWMLLGVAAALVLTGLPAWLVLIGISILASLVGMTAGAFSVALLSALPNRVLGLLESDLLQALPLFVLMGALLHRLPLADTLLRVLERALGRTGAGPGLAGLGLGVLLAPMNGSVGAGVAMLARVLMPHLVDAGVARARAGSLVAVAGTLGVVIPPSLVLILLSDAMMRAHTEAANATHAAVRILNTQDVFRGALIPAGLLLALYVGLALLGMRARKDGPRGQGKPSPPIALQPTDIATALVSLGFVVALLTAVTLGYLYAVEAAAFGGVALFLFAGVRGWLSRAVLRDVLHDTMALTGALFAVLVGATVFTLVLRGFGTDRWLAELLARWPGQSAYVLLLAVMVILVGCSFVLDAFEIIFVVVPVVMPPLLMRVPDATWVAVLTLLVLQASFLIPPFGYAVLMLRNRMPGLDARLLARALFPFLAAQAVVIGLVLAKPGWLWRGPAAAAAEPAVGSPEQADELLRRQLDAPQQ
jgi:tripartite ATP-independent transporter DctM subunit